MQSEFDDSSNEALLKRPMSYFMKKHRWAFAAGIGALFMTNLLDVLTPLALKAGIDALEIKNRAGLYESVVLYIALMAGVSLFRFSWRIAFGRFHHTVANELRVRIFTKLTTLGPSFFQRRPIGDLMSLMINDVNSFRMGIGPGVLLLLDAAFYTAFILPIMIHLSWSWTWKTLIFLPLLPFFMRKMEHVIHKRFRVEQDRLADVSANAQEIVSGVRVLKSFAEEDNHRSLFNVRSKAYEEACNGVAKADAVFHPVMDGAVAMGSVVLLWFCTPDVAKGTITLGTFVAFHEYIRRMIWPMTAIGLSVSMIEQGRASFTRIHDLLAEKTDIPDGKIECDRFESLEVKDLTFRYHGAEHAALKDVNLRIEAGETLGIVGPVGSGKSTLLHLLCRMYAAPKATVFLNGLDIADLKRRSLSSLVSLVPQDAFLFSDSVEENIGYGFDAFPGRAQVEAAARSTNIDAEIRALPENYAAMLGERGVNLSGGQKQRMTIARAWIREAQVLMLDDSLSAVDGRTEQAIVQELKEARAENPSQTVIVVSHRLASLAHADRIVVLNNGLIEAVGTHSKLLETSVTYRQLHDLQNESAG
jgi:ATP-binding cassette subfamily B protein